MSFSGVVVMIFRVMTKTLMDDGLEGSRKSALIFFVLSAIFVFICILLYFVLLKLDITKFYLNKTMKSNFTENIPLEDVNGQIIYFLFF